MWDGSAVFCRSTLSVYLCIWSTLLGSAVLFPSDSGHSVNTISASHVCLSLPLPLPPSLNPPHCHTEKTAPSIPLHTHRAGPAHTHTHTHIHTLIEESRLR